MPQPEQPQPVVQPCQHGSAGEEGPGVEGGQRGRPAHRLAPHGPLVPHRHDLVGQVLPGEARVR
eukprot:scaffold17861_cov56-Isochrysis_galbana.AAC.1